MIGIGALSTLKKALTNVTLIPETGVPVTALINPKELEYSKSVGWSEQQENGRNFPKLQFTSGKAVTISVEMMFDKYEEGSSVRPMTDALYAMSLVNEDLHRPPKVRLIWGGNTILPEGFEGVVESVKVRFTMFSSTGIPLRAVATVGLKQATEAEASGNSPDIAKQRIVRRGETLQSIAESEYLDASEWRRIADANNIDDPLALEPGMKLLVPPIL